MVYTRIRLLLLIRSFIFSFSNIQIYTFLRNCEAYKVETWYTRGQWTDVSYIPESGSCCCIFVPLFFHFSFSPIFKHYNVLPHLSQEL